MKADSYKHAYPRTLLADVLALLMERRGIDFAGLEHLSGVNRGTIHEIASAKRSCESEVRRALLAHLVNGDGNLQRLAKLFEGETEQLLTVPELVAAMEPSFATRRQRAVQDGLDIGALGERYGLNELHSDALAMEQAGKWAVACRWALHMVATARRSGDTFMELGSQLFHARLLMASSRFAESRNALASVFRHPALVTANGMAGDNAALIRIHAGVYLGWLNYEIGDYTGAVQSLDSAIALIETLCPVERGMDNGRCVVSVDLLCGLRELDAKDRPFSYVAPSDLLNLALHIRGKVLAERAMYVPEYMDQRNILAAGRALVKSAAIAGFLGCRGMLGHCLLWLARLAEVRAANIATGVSPSLLSAEEDRILRAAKMSAAGLLARCLDKQDDPKALLSIASRACFGGFQSSDLNRGYYQRAKMTVRALEGNGTGALSSFEDAYDLFTHYAPDARGLGPLLYERYLLESSGPFSAGGRTDWLIAAIAVHPSGFLTAALRREQTVASRAGGLEALHTSVARVLTFQKPFGPLQRLGTALWGDAAVNVMRRNIECLRC